MKEIELLDKRKLREKHFLQPDGSIIAKIYDQPVHYKKNQKYEEIDNSLIFENGELHNKSNDFKINFCKDYLIFLEKDKCFLKIKLANIKNYIPAYEKHNKLNSTVRYADILDKIDIEYKLSSNIIKENIIIKSSTIDYKELFFRINTNLELVVDQQNRIIAKNDEKILFIFDEMYMFDSTKEINKNIKYNLIKEDYDNYLLRIVLDENWINSDLRKYPIIIDPTIIDYDDNNLIDTYIYPNDQSATRYDKDILKVGVEKVNNNYRTNRALLRFGLPSLGTGSQIVKAMLHLIGYPVSTNTSDSEKLSIHAVTENWSESGANWNNMNDKYDSHVEGCFDSKRSYITNGNLVPAYCNVDITDLVKKWYTNTPNYGLLIKAFDETYKSTYIPAFYSKNNSVSGDNPRPLLEINYRNLNGLEKYLNYKEQSFENGLSFVNTYNGNLTILFDLCKSISSNVSTSLYLVYNTNDVILQNNYGFGNGYKLNLFQTIKETVIGNNNYLEYLDEDGTIHYFVDFKEEIDENGEINVISNAGEYYDEDKLGLTIVNNENEFTMIDTENNILHFTKNNNNIGYLTSIVNKDSESIQIIYENEKIVEVIDPENNHIYISYSNSQITINNSSEIILLNILNDKIVSHVKNSKITYIEYNANNIINKIVDFNNKKLGYEYYEVLPYRVKKITEYGIDNSIGKYENYFYGLNSTNIVDNKNRSTTLTFDSNGVLICKSNLPAKSLIKNAFGSRKYVGKDFQYKHKFLGFDYLSNSIINLIKNPSFEYDNLYFQSSNSNVSISDETSRTGNKCLKVNFNSLNSYISYNAEVEKGNWYTFSLYSKNLNRFKIEMSYINSNNAIVLSEEIIGINSKFVRNCVSVFYPSDSTSDLLIKIIPLDLGTIYIDDVQLENGEVANQFNILENSDFHDGLIGWDFETYDEMGNLINTNNKEIINLPDNQKALKIKMNPNYSTGLLKSFKCKGNMYDSYTISFWYKNSGVHVDEIDSFNDVVVNFKNTDDEFDEGQCAFASDQLNINTEEWQYFCETFYALNEYDTIEIIFSQSNNANELLLTNICLFKDFQNILYDRDKNGNITEATFRENGNIYRKTINYNNNNNCLNIIRSNGQGYSFEYNKVTHKLMQKNVINNLSNKLLYDEDGQCKAMFIRNYSVLLSNTEIKKIYVRVKGTEKYLDILKTKLILDDNKYVHSVWKLIPYEINNKIYYKIMHSVINKYLNATDNSIILSSSNSEESLFSIEYTASNNYLIKSKINNKYLQYYNNELRLCSYIENDENFEFVFENINNKKFIESSINYENDHKYSIIYSNLAKYILDYNEQDRTIISTDLNNDSLIHKYGNEHLNLIKYANKLVTFNYNNAEQLSEIITNNTYKIGYDEFLNLKDFKIGNNSFINYEYESNNGNLIKITFGNGNIIQYQYDQFNRITRIDKNGKTYDIKYDNYGNIYSIESIDQVIKMIFNDEHQLKKYITDNFIISYDYENYLIKNKNIKVQNDLNSIEYNYDNFNNIIQQIFDEYEFNYEYDELNRIIRKGIDGKVLYDYVYIDYGNRATTYIKEFKVNNDIYQYCYNNSDNITKICLNNKTINSYKYDSLSQLIQEINYLDNTIIKYKYDNNGNIISNVKYDLRDYRCLENNIFEYGDNTWHDKLTKYNGKQLSYDQIGNIVSVENECSLYWESGSLLSRYTNLSNNIQYKYNSEGTRIYKNVNGVITNYFLENKKIIAEEFNNNKIYYIRETTGDLIGFKYNNDLFFYIKNLFDDIVAIIDEDNNLIAKYEYDSWGNIIKTTDGNDNDVSNNMNHIANINPFRYRSYYYDKETNLYYLNSRYYSPTIKRYISADKVLGSNNSYLGYNLFLYCGNNPVNRIDENGKGWFKKAIKKAKTFGKITWELFKAGVDSLVGVEVNYTSMRPDENIPQVKNYPGYRQTEYDNGKGTTVSLTKKKKLIMFEINVNQSETGTTYSGGIQLNIKSNSFELGVQTNDFKSLDKVYFQHTKNFEDGRNSVSENVSLNPKSLYDSSIGIEAIRTELDEDGINFKYDYSNTENYILQDVFAIFALEYVYDFPPLPANNFKYYIDGARALIKGAVEVLLGS